MIITQHAYDRAKERMNLSEDQVKEDILKWMKRWCKRKWNECYLRWKEMIYAWTRTPSWLVIKTALWKSQAPDWFKGKVRKSSDFDKYC